MKTLSWFALVLVISPLLAFGCLAAMHPIGDPQQSGSLLVRLLDLQGTYWIRNGIPVPPPLLVAGLPACGFLWWRTRFPSVLAGTVVGIALLGLWALMMVVPLLVHVN
jgi:hypothetical protein